MDFTYCARVSGVDFEKINASWERYTLLKHQFQLAKLGSLSLGKTLANEHKLLAYSI